MSKKICLAVATVLSATVLTVVATAPAAHAAPVSGAAKTASTSVRLTPAAAALATDPQTALTKYWTSDRIASARVADQSISADVLRRSAQSSLLGSVTVPGSGPRAASTAGKLTTLAGATGTSWPYRHDWVALTNGKVLYEKADGSVWMCSGVVVTSEAANTVFTAGHCVHDGPGGGWNNINWTFIPDYYYNDRPLGTWTARELWALNGWINDGDRAYDVAAAVMYRNNGQRLADVTGSQGIRINGATTPYVWHFGFPANSPFDGEDLITCDGQTSRRYGIFGGDLKLACTMQGGASGGAWLADFNGESGYTVSVNSYHVGDDLTQIYGPYFGDGTYNLYQAVRNLTS